MLQIIGATSGATIDFTLAIRVLEAAMRRVGWLFTSLEGIVSRAAAAVEALIIVVPPAIILFIAAMLLWRTRNAARAAITVLALQVLVLTGTWNALTHDVGVAVVAGSLGIAVALAIHWAVHRLLWRGRAAIDLDSQLKILLAGVGSVFTFGAIPLIREGGAGLPLNLVAPILCTWIGLLHPWVATLGGVSSVSERLMAFVRSAFIVGLAGAVLSGSLVGRGLGGLAEQAIRTGEVVVAIEATIASVALAVALLASFAAPRDPGSIAESSGATTADITGRDGRTAYGDT